MLMRVVNTKDGYALNLAARKNIHLAIITGGNAKSVYDQYTRLGFCEIYLEVKLKIEKLHDFLTKYKLDASEVLYMGDDIPDYEVMRAVGVPVCPNDAAPEIKAISVYVSPLNGGYGCVRDVVEQVLKAQGHWMTGKDAFGW